MFDCTIRFEYANRIRRKGVDLKKAKASEFGSRRRKAGRPPLPANAAGRDTLIKATIELLRTTPPAQVTLRGVARRCHVDPALVRYYFGDKSGLLVDAASHILAELRQRIVSTADDNKSVRERISDRVSYVLDLFVVYPYLHPLVLEIIHWEQKAGKEAIKQIAGFARVVKALVEYGVREEELKPIDYRLLHIAIFGLCEIFATTQPVIAELFGGKVDARITRAYHDFVVDLLVDGLRGRADKTRHGSKRSPASAD
jgi:AcrR family transcriptional regulator